MKTVPSGSVCALLCLCVATCNAVEYTKVITGYTSKSTIMDINPGNLQGGDEFGIKVDMWNGLAGITSVGRSVNENMEVVSSGHVYLFSSSNDWEWKYTGTVLNSDYTEDGFGLGLSVGDGVIAVGAPYDSRWVESAGAVYIFTGYAPSLTSTTIYAEHTDKEAYFGSSVAIVRSKSHFKNGAIVVGAPGHPHENHKNVGAVFVYSKNYNSAFYKLSNMLEPSEMKDGGNLGYSMAVYGNTLAVGAPGANAVYVYELLLHVEECPHDHEHRQDLPPDSCQGFHRNLQGEEGEHKEGENKEGDNQQEREREEREREEREREEHENHQVYYVWKYDEVLAIRFEDEHSYENAKFGTSLAVYNNTVLSVVVGAPGMISATSSLYDAGAVYVFTKMNKNDMWPNYVPEGYNEHEEPHHLRKLQGEDHHEDHHHEHWDPTKRNIGWDSTNNFWLRETILYGDTASGQFGYSVAADYNNLVIGSNNEKAFGKGSVKVYQRQATNVQDYDRPIISGPLFKKVFSLSGKLSDSKGNNGDKFGTALSLYGNQLLVGSYLKGMTSATNVGTGAAYIYNRIGYVVKTAAPTPVITTTSSSSSFFSGGHINMSSAVQISLGVSLVFLVSVLGAYGVYKYRGGKTDATVVLQASLESVKEFGSSVASKLPFMKGDKKTVISLSSIDDSTSSQSPMNEPMDSSRGSLSSTSSGRSFDRSGNNNMPPVRYQQQHGAPMGGNRSYQPRGPPSYPQQPRGTPRGPHSYPQQPGQTHMQNHPGQRQHPGTSTMPVDQNNRSPHNRPRPSPPQRSTPYGSGAGRGGHGNL